MDPLEHIIQFLRQTDELSTATQLLRTFKKYSTSIDQYDQLGRLFHDVKAYEDSLDCAERTLALSSSPQQSYSSRQNLAKILNHLNLPNKALQYINANLSLNEHDYESKMEKVFSLYLSGNQHESKKLTEELLSDPNCPEQVKNRSKYNYGSYLLDDNKFKEGMKNFIEVGHKIGIWPKINFPGQPWDGSTKPNANIAILAEGGYGDEIIGIRFMKHIKDRGMNPIFVTNRDDLVTLFSRNGFPTVRTIHEVPEDSLWCLEMMLPILLDLDANDIYYGPYLKPSETYIEKWKKILPDGKKVAIKYQGNPHYEQDLHRSLPIDTLNDLLNFNRDDVTFISVQKEENSDITQYPNIVDVSKHLETMEDLLACLSLMDITISSCTSVAHVSAAAGFPTVVCPPLATYYVWLGNTKWYGDNVTILRQRKWKDWSHLEPLRTLL